MSFRVADLDLFLTLPDSRRRWRYRTDDVLAAVMAPGYFDHADAPVWRDGDVIEVSARGGVGRHVRGAPVAWNTVYQMPVFATAAAVAEPETPSPDPLLAVRLAGAPKPP